MQQAAAVAAAEPVPVTGAAKACGGGATAAGDPLVTTYTKTAGTFSLAGVPVGSNITLAIQLGRWRRLFTVNVPNACQANVVTGTGHGGGAIAGGVSTNRSARPSTPG